MSFLYINNCLSLQSSKMTTNLCELVKDKEEAFYFYDLSGILQRTKEYQSAFKCNLKVHFAMKANSNPELLKSMAKLGIGVDIVSMGELKLAQEAGFSADKIIFSGVGKSRAELTKAIKDKIKHLNVESLEELKLIAQIAAELKIKASVVIRLNPDVDPKTHPYICTGFRENKFGLDLSELSAIKSVFKAQKEHIDFSGLSLHIGSQIRDVKPFRESIIKIYDVYKNLCREGFALRTLNIGGGLGVQYEDVSPLAESFSTQKANENDLELLKKYADVVSEIFKDFDGEVLTEPGRFLTAPFGLLLTKILYLKRTPYKNFLIVNTGMHHLLRPALYQAYHRIVPLKFDRAAKVESYDVVGPICESSDVLGRDRLLPEQKSQNWLAIMDVGAYGRSMSSQYNSHELPQEVVVVLD